MPPHLTAVHPLVVASGDQGPRPSAAKSRLLGELVMAVGEHLRVWARRVKRDGLTLWFAGKSPRTPWYAKALGGFVVAYALSPIDLIPDFIPVLGYIDDVLLLPGLIWLTVKLLPEDVLLDCRRQADEWIQAQGKKPRSKAGVVLVIAVWLLVSALGYSAFRDWF